MSLICLCELSFTLVMKLGVQVFAFHNVKDGGVCVCTYSSESTACV